MRYRCPAPLRPRRPCMWGSRRSRSRTMAVCAIPHTIVGLSRFSSLRWIRNSAALAANKDPAVAVDLRAPDAEIYAIDVSFPELKDKAELDYLNRQPTSFVLPAEAVDRLRAAAGAIIMASPEFQRLLKDVGAKIVTNPPAGGDAAAVAVPTTSSTAK